LKVDVFLVDVSAKDVIVRRHLADAAINKI